MVLPQLKELIVQFSAEFTSGHFPEDCNKQRVDSVNAAIKAIKAATTQTEMLSISAAGPRK